MVNTIEDVGIPSDEKQKEHQIQLNRSLFDFLKSIDSNTAYDSYLQYYKSFSGFSFNLFIFGLDVSLRNLPARLLKLTFGSIEGTYLKGNFVVFFDEEREFTGQGHRSVDGQISYFL